MPPSDLDLSAGRDCELVRKTEVLGRKKTKVAPTPSSPYSPLLSASRVIQGEAERH